MMRVLITGGSGLLGTALRAQLLAQGHEVVLLSRSPRASGQTGVNMYGWDLDKGTIDRAALEGLTHVVHLAGAGIADHRWTPAWKQEVIDSRVKGMALLERELIKHQVKLKAFVGASGVGYYGMLTSEKIFTETDPPATDDFLVECCKAWEGSYDRVPVFSERLCVLRIGVVLSAHGGALKRMLPVFTRGFGSALGSGRQYMPWIHETDIAGLMFRALSDENMKGTFNAVAPQHMTNMKFSKALAAHLHKPFWAPKVPAVVLKAMFGDMAGVILEGSRVSCEKLQGAGFTYRFPDLDAALRDVLERR